MKYIKYLSTIMLCVLFCLTSCNKNEKKGTITLTADQDTVYMNPADSTNNFLTGQIKTTDDFIESLSAQFLLQGTPDYSSFNLAMSFSSTTLSNYYYAFNNNNLNVKNKDYRPYITYIKEIVLTATSKNGLVATKSLPVVVIKK